MIKLIDPQVSKSDLDKLHDLLNICLSCSESFKFLTTSLVEFDTTDIEGILEEQMNNGVEFLVYENGDHFDGLLLCKSSKWEGFELFLLVVNSHSQNKGIGQQLISQCIDMAENTCYQSVDASVYSDNKRMLRLLIKNDFRPIDIKFHVRADGMDMIKLRRYI